MRLQNLALAMLVGVAGLAGCVTDGEGSASIYVKDAPTDEFDEIHVLFSAVEVHYAGNGSDEDDGNETDAMDGNETDEDDGEWRTIVESESGIDVDLLNASGTRSAFLGEADLEAGTYTQIRVHVIEAYGIEDGERSDFFVPSGTLKLVRSFEVQADQETKITLDFDLDRSLKQTGNGQWILTPVVGMTYVEVVEDDESGEDVHQEGDIQEDAAVAA